MNLEFFGLTERPFLAEPFPEGFCPTGPVENARKEVTRCVHRMEGVSLVTGPSGCGKTLLCRVLARDFEDELDVSVLCGRNLITPKTLFQTILAQLGISYTNRDENELRISVFDYLSLPEYSLKGLLIIVDDAHALRMRILEELRQLLDSVFSARSGVRLMLAGLPTLEEKLTDPKLYAFSQRITTRCFLEALSRDETEELLRTRILSCGGRLSLFSSDVCREIHRFSDGVPRVVHQLADHVLLCTYQQRQKKITPEIVQFAWNSLQQIPEDETEAAWVSPSQKSVAGSVVSFSTSLEDDFSEDGELSGEFSEFTEDFTSPEPPADFTENDTVEFGTLDAEPAEHDMVRQAVRETTVICNEFTPPPKPAAEVREKSAKAEEKDVKNTSPEELATLSAQEIHQFLNSLMENLTEKMKKSEVKEAETEQAKENKENTQDEKPVPQSPVKVFDADATERSTRRTKNKKRRRNPEKAGHSRSTIPFRHLKTEHAHEADTIISRAYLENTVHSFSQLHAMLEALLREISSGERAVPQPSRMWIQLHSMTASVMEQLVEERFGSEEVCPVKLPFTSSASAKSGVATCPFRVVPGAVREKMRYRKRKNSRVLQLLENILGKLSAMPADEAEILSDFSPDFQPEDKNVMKTPEISPTRYKKAQAVAEIEAKLQAVAESLEAEAEIAKREETTASYQSETLLEDPEFADVLARLKTPGKFRLDDAANADYVLPPLSPAAATDFLPEDYHCQSPRQDNRVLQEYLRKCQLQLDTDQDFAERFHDILSQLKTLEMDE